MYRFEIHSHSDYSNIRLLDSINRIEKLLTTANNKGLAGITLTDHEALSGHVDMIEAFEKLKKKEKLDPNFKIGLGNEIYLIDSREKEKIRRYFHFILIAKNNDGHKALRELSSIAWYNSFFDRGMERVPTLKEDLRRIAKKYPNSLIGSTACIGSELGYWVTMLLGLERSRTGDTTEAIIGVKQQILDFVNYGKEVFGDDFYLEIAPSYTSDQKAYNKRLLDIARATNVKLVIGTDAHYPTLQDRPIHKAYLNSKNGEREVDDFYASAYLMDEKEIHDYLDSYIPQDTIEQMFANSLEIMNKIEGYNLHNEQVIPVEEVKFYSKELPQDIDKEKYPSVCDMFLSESEQDRYWINSCFNALMDKGLYNDRYMDRLNIEAEVITFISQKLKQSLTGYFNTLQYYIDLFWECGSIVGPGRGSAVGFLSDYLLGITQIDPLRWDLPYWRFLNKERAEMPDIDIDLAPSKRPLIFKRIRAKKGETRLIQVATFGTEGTRSAIQTACRGYRSEEYPNGIDVDIAQYMSGMIPQERGFLWPISDVIKGNEEKDRKPIRSFIDEVNKYPGLLDIMENIEGLVNKRSSHASGVILYNQEPTETNAIMRTPSGDLITQFDLHHSEWLGDIKYDFLLTEVSDKIINSINLLQRDKMIEPELSLREVYNKYLHPESINIEDERIWQALSEGSVIDVFQFNSDVGLQAAKLIKPANPIDMTAANALMRLMGEKGKERPLDRYARLKFNFYQWDQEIDKYGLTAEDKEVLKPYYIPRYGTPCMQEDLMRVVMDKNISGFTLKESNDARKIVAKKEMSRIPELKEKFFKSCSNTKIAHYVWDTVIAPQLGYAFSILHSLAYSFVGIQTLILATNWPSIYWNCACLIANSGGNDEDYIDDIYEIDNPVIGEDEEEEDDEDEDEDDTPVKKRNKTTKYGKVATAIGTMQQAGIVVSPPHINKSTFTFSPDLQTNSILYGISGINKIGINVIKEILANRPYTSLNDFLKKVKVNKPQLINLIKSGAFDEFGESREKILEGYIRGISDQKQRLTLQNMQMLISYDLIPEEIDFERKLFNFNKYIKKNRVGIYYGLDETAFPFYESNFDVDLLVFEVEGYQAAITQDKWDKIYKKGMEPARVYLKAHQEEMLQKLNDLLIKDSWDKYGKGNISKWEMESISFYYHEHELANVREEVYNFVNFFDLPDEPIIDKIVTIKGREVPLYKLFKICGTVLDKDKNKSTVTLLTKYGVVPVKIYQAQFAKYDKQISMRLPDGKKKVIEKSWFTRGNKLALVGIRRGDSWVPKMYKNGEYEEVIEFIESIDDDGFISCRNQRAG